MRSLLFGYAGLRDPKDLEGSIKEVVDGGFAACEVQFVKEFILKEAEAKRLGEIARDYGVSLSVHAPYFAQLTTREPERIKLHLGGLHHACKLGSLMGATVVVCHPGSNKDATAEQLHEQVDKNLSDLGPRIADLGVKLGLETCGRKSQFGSLGDLALVVPRHPVTTVVIDYGHIHAVSNGSLNSPSALEALFDFITSSFGPEHLQPLHTHFSDNQWGPAGEIRHLKYGEGTLRIADVLEGASGFDLDLTVISEHKEAASHARVLDEIEASGVSLMRAGTKRTSSKELPVKESGDAHMFFEGGRQVRISNIDKILFPEHHLTKRDLATYYYNAAPLMLPFLRDRPITMQRVPEGIYGEAFYEKQRPKGSPEWVRSVPVPSDGGAKIIDFVIVDSIATLVWLAQIASVECHAWTCKWPNLDEPDFAVIDLDPHEPITFADVREVAELTRVLLDRLGLRAFPKTSGGSGIQIFIPLAQGHTYAEVRAFCTAIGSLIRSAYPEKVTMEPSKPKRAGKVFIDVNQNAKGKTLVAPYSVRPYPGAPVSTPLSWGEMQDDIFPDQFTISSVLERIDRVGDLFKPALSLKQDLHPALIQLGGAT
ncbi:MAG: non-homologous end-joining DNA ligase [Actinomycetota bacterium]